MEGRPPDHGDSGGHRRHQHHSHRPQQQQQEQLPTSTSAPGPAATPGTARVITDNPMESEDTFTESNYDSQSTFSSSFASTSVGSGLDRGSSSAAMHMQAQQPQQQQQQQLPTQANQPSSSTRAGLASNSNKKATPLTRRVAVRDGEITGGTTTIPSTAIVRRKPLHETLEEYTSEDNFEVALNWHRNKRILLSRLVETTPNGRLSLVRCVVYIVGIPFQ
jgi:hypothetical protein